MAQKFSFLKNIKLAPIHWLFMIVGIIGICGVIFIFVLSQDLPTLEQLEQYEQQFSTKLYSNDGVLLKELFFIKRSHTPLDSIPEPMIQAVLATEDRDFYSHWGFNSKRFVKAILIDIAAMDFAQGASTLSQQLARGLFLTQEKKLIRKVKELLLSIQIEYTYTKNEILEMYLNHMYFGHGAYGVQAAAQKYFGHDASQCNLNESALIIGLLQRPNAYSPFRNYDAALNRRNIVLRNMETVGYLDSATSTATQEDSIITKEFNSNEEFGIAPYFTEWVRQILQKKHGLSLYEDGLSVYTTLDSRMQACAEKAVRENLPDVQKKINHHFRQKNRYLQFLNPNDVERIGINNIKNNSAFIDSVINVNAAAQVAMVAIDPATGYIKAMVGGRNFEESKFNRVMQSRRQPGSAFKPIAFAAAIDNGYSPSTELLNQPVVLYMENGDIWRPENYGHSEGGPTTLREGLRKSYNLVAARLVQELVPPRQVVDFAHKIGIKSHLDAVDAISLGATGLTPIELTSAYCVFDNKGVATAPMSIIRVLDKYGSVMEENFPSYREAMREEVAYVMTNMMQTVIDHGTGIGARSRFQFYRPAAGKTGTTNDYTDAWFVGYTPQLVCGVWVGLDDPQFSLGAGQEGARVALPIWATFMKTAHDTMLATALDSTVWEEKKFVMPDGVVEVEICNETKKLATEACPHIVKEIFIRENAPTEYCDKHTSFMKPKSRRRHY